MNKEIEISPRQIAKAITDLLNEKEQLEQQNKELKEENKELKEKIILLQASEPMLELTKYYGEKDELQQENKELHNKIDEAIEELDRVITFCENDSQGVHNICNMAIRNYKNIREILKDSDVDE